jgi:trehalose 6-phosphate synthase
VSRTRGAALCRLSKVGLVTPLRDGMNLVAKEYVSAQDPDDPGVLVLSRFAGAAERLTAAVLVNPYDVEQMADALHGALRMPLEERRERHADLLRVVETENVHWWMDQFRSALEPAEATTLT